MQYSESQEGRDSCYWWICKTCQRLAFTLVTDHKNEERDEKIPDAKRLYNVSLLLNVLNILCAGTKDIKIQTIINSEVIFFPGWHSSNL
jgi:hypothetical protein